MFISLPSLNVKIVCVDNLIEQIEKQVEEDNHKFCLEHKSKLIRNFFVLRLCNELFNIIQNNKTIKLLYLVSKTAKLTLLKDHYAFVYAAFIKIAKILSLNFLIDSIKPEDIKKNINSDIGEYKEVRLKIFTKVNRLKKAPSIVKLKAYFKKYNITSTDTIDNNFNVKLGLFLT